ncbi:MAG TPA: ABC transporter substrate-binding protein [Stellaceae bacterium]|nr:ABC transporter substrate-binding protein [Stellaceae bacterium]
MRLHRWLSSLFAALALVAGAASPGRAEPVTIRFGWAVVPATIVPLLVERKDLATHLGSSYNIELTHFQGSPTLMTALGAHQIDIVTLAFSSFALAVVNGGMTDLRIIGGEAEDGAPGYNSNEFMVAKDSPIKTIEDLKGKVLATNVFGSAVDIAMRALLRKHGLENKRDYTIIEVNFPNMRAMLADHRVDLISAVEPFSMDPGLRANARTLFTERDAMGTSLLAFWVAHPDFLQKNRAAVLDFMEDFLRGVRWYLDPANHAKAVAEVARFLKQPPARFAWAFTKNDQYRSPDGVPNLAALQSNIDLQRATGFLNGKVDVQSHADLGLMAEAAKRLH